MNTNHCIYVDVYKAVRLDPGLLFCFSVFESAPVFLAPVLDKQVVGLGNGICDLLLTLSVCSLPLVTLWSQHTLQNRGLGLLLGEELLVVHQRGHQIGHAELVGQLVQIGLSSKRVDWLVVFACDWVFVGQERVGVWGVG